MFNWYKRFVIAHMRWLQKFPGLRTYGRFMERHYTKHFWRTFITASAIGAVINLVAARYLKAQKPSNDRDRLRKAGFTVKTSGDFDFSKYKLPSDFKGVNYFK